MMQRIPAIAVSIALGIGFGYACLGVLSIIGSRLLGMTTFGFRLWWLEVLVAVAAGFGAFLLFRRIETRQTDSPRSDRGERAILRLAYRNGNELTVEQITNATLLDQSAALEVLKQLEARGSAADLGGGRWRLVKH